MFKDRKYYGIGRIKNLITLESKSKRFLEKTKRRKV
jgi:hypothetical protein